MPSDAAVKQDAAAACGPSMIYGGGETSMTGAMVTAKIVDETGTAVPSQPVYILSARAGHRCALARNDVAER